VLREDRFDIVIASRYVEGGSSEGLAGSWRHRLSETGIQMAQALLPVRLTDPMSGFFMMRRDSFERNAGKLTGEGFKILLDLLLPPRHGNQVGIGLVLLPEVLAGGGYLQLVLLQRLDALADPARRQNLELVAVKPARFRRQLMIDAGQYFVGIDRVAVHRLQHEPVQLSHVEALGAELAGGAQRARYVLRERRHHDRARDRLELGDLAATKRAAC